MADVSEAAGIPFRTYQAIDMGHTWPELKNLEAIAKEFGVDVISLFMAEEAPDPSPERALEIIAKALKTPKKVPESPDIRKLIGAINKSPRLLRSVLALVDGFESVER